ncbi:MAG TPA: two-component regulator propeller domain-containing protein [Puia sp.]|jgi:signal transduction histidine kinase/ligand-binding sensor domain-containing protein
MHGKKGITPPPGTTLPDLPITVRQVLLFLVPLVLIFPTSARFQLLPIRNYTTREGLNTNSISAILRDSRGILWVGTYNGVNWYDGERFLQPPMHTRSGQIYVTNFLEDRNKDVWVTSWYSGLYKYANGRFTNYLVDTIHLESQANSAFDLLELDPDLFLVATDRNVWLFHQPTDNPAATVPSGNPSTTHPDQKTSNTPASPGNPSTSSPPFTLFDPANRDLDLQINTLALTARHDILIGYQKGLAWYRRQGQGWTYAGMLWKDTGVSKIWLRGDQCWLASSNGLYCFPHLSALCSPGNPIPPSSPRQPLPSPIPVYPGPQTDHIFIGKDSAIWFATGDGVQKLSGDPLASARSSLHSRIQSYTSRNGLPSNAVTSIQSDEEDVTWLGTEDGLARLNKEYYHFYPGKATIISLNTDRQGRLWMGSYSGLRQMQGGETSAITRIGKKDLGFVFCLLKDTTGDLFACTDAGILRINGKRPEQISPAVALCASLARDGSLWFGDAKGRIFHRENNRFREVPNASYVEEHISAIFSDRNGYLWVGYGLTGLKKFRPTTTGLELMKEYTSRSGYSNMRVRSLVDDGHGHLLAGTRTNGLYLFDIDPPPSARQNASSSPGPPTHSAPDPPLLHLSTGQGLSGNWIKTATAGSQGLFLATNNGLDLLDLSDIHTPVIRPIPFRNDQVPSELNTICLQSDTIWLGTAKGVLQYIPNRRKKNRMPPPAYIMKVTINGRTDSSFQPFTAQASLPPLSYRQNSIAFDFAGLSFRDEENVRYRYRMEGLDKEWSATTARRYVNYSNLAPGDYRFRVIAENSDSIWSATPATLSFHISAPFWLTGWFIALCTVLLAALLYALYRYRLKQALKIERLRTKISTDLHDDIGSTLSSISIMSDMILQENKGGSPDVMALEIKENSLSLMDKMDDIVWSINPRNDALEDLMARIQRFASQLFEAKGIDYEIGIGNNIRRLRLPMESRQNVYLIMKEAVINLVKYSRAGRAVIKASSVDHLLQVEISDDGKGFTPADAGSGNGIVNMKNRAALMKAGFQIHSTPGKGTTVILSLKIK